MKTISYYTIFTPFIRFQSWMGEITTSDNVKFTVLNLNQKLKPGPPVLSRIMVKFNRSTGSPKLRFIRLNGRKICPEDTSEWTFILKTCFFKIWFIICKKQLASPLKTYFVRLLRNTFINSQTLQNFIICLLVLFLHLYFWLTLNWLPIFNKYKFDPWIGFWKCIF